MVSDCALPSSPDYSLSVGKDGALREQLVDASFVPITDAHLDVPLYWQSWKLDSDTVAQVTDAVTAAAAGLRRRR